MIIDAHTHLSNPDVRENRDVYVCPAEPAFSAIYCNPAARLCGADELVRVMDEEGVDRSVAFGFPFSGRDAAMAQNDYLREAMERFPERLIGLGCFDPLAPWAVEEAERTLEAGLKGIGELAVYDAGFDEAALEKFGRLAEVCRKYHAPLVVHVNEPIGHQYPGKAPLTLEMIYGLVKACQGLKLVLAHFGGGLFFYHTLKKEVPDALADVYYDTAAAPFLYKPEIYALASRIVGPEKVLFGTDYPLLRPGRYFKDMDKAGLDERERAWIAGDAAAAVFGLV